MIKQVQTAIPLPYAEIAGFCELHHIVRLSLFGSVLRDDFHPDSDVDVLIEFDPLYIPGWKIVSIEAELSALIGREVEFTMPDALSAHVKADILQSAQVIYERA